MRTANQTHESVKAVTTGTQLDGIHKVPASKRIAGGADLLFVEEVSQGVGECVILVFQSKRRRVVCFVHGVTRSLLITAGNCNKTTFDHKHL